MKRLVPLLFMLRGVLRIDVAESYLGGSNASIVLGIELSLLRANNKAVVLASPRDIPLSCKYLLVTRNSRNTFSLTYHIIRYSILLSNYTSLAPKNYYFSDNLNSLSSSISFSYNFTFDQIICRFSISHVHVVFLKQVLSSMLHPCSPTDVALNQLSAIP